MKDNKELIEQIQKSGLLTSDGGIMPPEASNHFIDLTVDQSAVLKTISVEKNIASERFLDTIGVGNRMIMKAGEPAVVTAGDIKKPALSRRSLVPVDCLLPYDISFKWLDENIERKDAEDTINKAFAAQFSNDLVDLMINGDKTAGPGTDQKFLQIADGLKIKLTADSNAHYAERGDSTDWKGQVFPALLKELPSKYKTDPSRLVFLTSFDAEEEYINSLAERGTALGDLYLTEGRKASYKGISVQPIPAMPYGMVILTRPKNLAIGFGSNIKVYKQLKPRELNIEYTIAARVDFNYADSNGIVYTM
jgi:hypothetical protein